MRVSGLYSYLSFLLGFVSVLNLKDVLYLGHFLASIALKSESFHRDHTFMCIG